ncbi:hypothetical protein OC835_003505 [Tilletia horrida]|uniref:CENP-V/GFA domain-containing protein n=1 Tax=Tilletia horrida TaxID=155126 RepID=A0AAN6GB95_9BASI|nr:hypothetical protein OC842_003702 [Tilletia horrida]KAK0531924.1 hypothetical protein OC835_003505 [Tilletia horrida]
MPLLGSCLCKAVQVQVADDVLPLKFAQCFCQNCATSHSAPGCIVAGMLTKFVTITGPTTEYCDLETDSGKAVKRAFCPTCGTPIRSWPEIHPEVTALRGGLFARSSAAEDTAQKRGHDFVFSAPVEEMYTERRERQFPWLAAQSGAKQWARKGDY